MESLKSGRPVVACIAPSFPGELEENVTPGQLVSGYQADGVFKGC